MSTDSLGQPFVLRGSVQSSPPNLLVSRESDLTFSGENGWRSSFSGIERSKFWPLAGVALIIGGIQYASVHEFSNYSYEISAAISGALFSVEAILILGIRQCSRSKCCQKKSISAAMV